MRVLLVIIAGFALFGAVSTFPIGGGAVSVGCLTIFVLAGTGAAVLEYLIGLSKEAKRQTALLEDIARQTRVPGSDSKSESSATYRIPGL